MNYIADRLADAEYHKPGGIDTRECLRHHGQWKLLHESNRVTSMSSDALETLKDKVSALPVAEEQGISDDDRDR